MKSREKRRVKNEERREEVSAKQTNEKRKKRIAMREKMTDK